MATVDKKFADRLIAGDGLLPECGEEAPDNPPASSIVEFTNAWGKTAYGVVFEGERDQEKYMHESDYVQSPRVIWQRNGSA